MMLCMVWARAAPGPPGSSPHRPHRRPPERSVMTPKERLAALRDAELDGKPIEIRPFRGHRASASGAAGPGCLSQWWPAQFTVDGVVYPTAEHWMMAAKARLFGDADGLAVVLAAKSPGEGQAA